MSKGTILHVSEALGGGVFYAVVQLANAQVSAGFKVEIVFSIRPETPSAAELDDLINPSVVRTVLPMVTNPNLVADIRTIRDLRRIYNRLKPDIIHLHSSKAGLLGRLLSFAMGLQKRTFYTPHGYAFLRKDISKTKRIFYSLVERGATFFKGRILACSAYEAELARSKLRNKDVFLAENAVVLPQVSVREQSDRLVVSTLGRISIQKAPDRFRELARELAIGAVDFVWIGDGPDRMLLESLPNYGANVFVLGWRPRDEAINILANSDIFVLLSNWEGLPLALIEAQLLGVPCIVSNIPGCRDVIVDGVTGFVCNDVLEAKIKIRLLIENRELREKLGREARIHAEKRFSVEHMLDQVYFAYSMAGIKC